jgi:hypothetical protein
MLTFSEIALKIKFRLFTFHGGRMIRKQDVYCHPLLSLNARTSHWRKFGSMLFLFLGFLAMMTPVFAQQDQQTILLVNHTGYSLTGEKKTVLQTLSAAVPASFQVIDPQGNVVFENAFAKGGAIDHWHTGKAYAGYFTDLKKPGTFRIRAVLEGQAVASQPFVIKKYDAALENLSLLMDGFVSQHPIKMYDDRDRNIPFIGGRKGTVDVHGGWSDASGDVGKHLSHLSFAIYMNPQQAPFVLWSLLESVQRLRHNAGNVDSLLRRMRKEAAYGADFLVRMQDPEGYFYISIFDGEWSRDPARRFIGTTRNGTVDAAPSYHAAMREGGGVAIAALARASSDGIAGEYSGKRYLQTAEKGFAHLKAHNLAYLFDGKENIIDDYCALLASTELYSATKKSDYLEYARGRAQNLVARMSADDRYKGWWRADETGSRPYFHAVEAGFPMVALCRFLDVEKQGPLRQKVIAALRASADFELGITSEVNNPFGYARQYVKAVNEPAKRSAFFMPHKNETGYWWQGENARLASLAGALAMATPYLNETQQPRARRYAADQLDWILGLNPFDMCMLDGAGRNNPAYHETGGNLNYRGGVCNGITGGDDETDVVFMPPPYDKDVNSRWRWAEQWLPHSSWLLLALAASMAD